jgi:hypothetical protein
MSEQLSTADHSHPLTIAKCEVEKHSEKYNDLKSVFDSLLETEEVLRNFLEAQLKSAKKCLDDAIEWYHDTEKCLKDPDYYEAKCQLKREVECRIVALKSNNIINT